MKNLLNAIDESGLSCVEIIPTLTCDHPESLCCPICGCCQIWYWPELKKWDSMSDKQKRRYEVCPCCNYGSKDFPYEEYE